MTDNGLSFREALARIVEVANDAMNAGEDTDHEHGEASSGHVQKDRLVCSPKSLPQRVLIKAAETAVKINPMNAVVFASAQAAASLTLEPQHIAVLTSKYWGLQPRRFTVSFMEATPADLRARILSHMNAWNATSGMSFVETRANGEVRISRAPAASGPISEPISCTFQGTGRP